MSVFAVLLSSFGCATAQDACHLVLDPRPAEIMKLGDTAGPSVACFAIRLDQGSTSLWARGRGLRTLVVADRVHSGGFFGLQHREIDLGGAWYCWQC